MPFFTYILRCADATFYIGSTNNLEKRLHAHNHLKNGAHYTKIRRPVSLVFSQQFETLHEARAKEVELKKLGRRQKEQLISQTISTILFF